MCAAAESVNATKVIHTSRLTTAPFKNEKEREKEGREGGERGERRKSDK